MTLRLALVLVGLIALALPARAAVKAAVFPFELEQEPSEEDFYIGAKGPDDAEAQRLKLVTDELRTLLIATGSYELVDIAPVEADASALSPLHKCNGCEGDLARKLGAGVAVTGFLEKLSATLLNMYVTFRNPQSGEISQRLSVVIRGNTDDEWLHAIRYAVKNRLKTGVDKQ